MSSGNKMGLVPHEVTETTHPMRGYRDRRDSRRANGYRPSNAVSKGYKTNSKPDYTPEQIASFTAMYEEHAGSLYRKALRLTRNPADAEDLVQLAFLKAWRSLHTFQPGTSEKAWLFSILINAYIDDYRKSEREPGTEVFDETTLLYEIPESQHEFSRHEDELDPEKVVIDSKMDPAVEDALNSLDGFRDAVVLRDIEGFPYKEIDDVLGVPLDTVRTRIFKGRRILERKLNQYATTNHLLKQ